MLVEYMITATKASPLVSHRSKYCTYWSVLPTVLAWTSHEETKGVTVLLGGLYLP